MQITRVALSNIKNHARAEFTFLPGVVAICGPNGAGKTTILEAIAWALFDYLEYKREDFVKRGTKRGQVTVDFISTKDERLYSVTRDTAGAYSVFDPDTKTRLVEQKNQVVKFLREHIGVDETTDLAALFKTTIGVPQGTLTYDFLLTGARRKEIFDEILKVKEYKDAADKLRDTLKQIETRITETDRQLAETEGELKVFDATQQQYDEISARLQELARAIAQAQSERARAAAQVVEFDALKQQLATQRAASERLQVKLEVTRGTLATAHEALEQATKAAAIVAEAQAGFTAYQATGAQLTALEVERVKRDELRQQLQQIERQLIETQSKRQRLLERQTELEQARAELVALTEAVAAQAQAETQLAQLRERRGERQSLERARQALDKDLEQMRLRYSTLSKDIEKADSLQAQAESVPVLEAQRVALDAAIQTRQLAEQRAQLLRGELAKVQREHTRLQKELQARQAEQAKLTPLSAQAAQVTELETQQQQATDNLAHLRAEVARDEEMMQSLASGGICPLLTEKCLNLAPGESLDTRFRAGLQTRRAAIATLTGSLQTFAQQLQAARAAVTQTAQLPRLQSEIERLAADCAAQEATLAQTQSELAAHDDIAADRALPQLQSERAALDAALQAARQAERQFNQAAGLRGELDELKAQGKIKREEHDALTKRLAELVDTEQQITAAESALQSLNDPRGRANSLKTQLARVTEWETALTANAAQIDQISAAQADLQTQLDAFAELELRLAEVNVLRATHERAYHAYLSNQKIAERLATHEAEVAQVTAEIEQTETALAAAADAVATLALQYDAATHAQAQTEMAAQGERVTQLATQTTHTQQQFAQVEARLAQLHETRTRRAAYLAAKSRAEHLRTAADFIRDILQKAAPFITESYLFAVSAEANLLYREITGRHDVTLKWAKDYEITLEEEGRERPFANLSGGEQMTAALAVRLALLKELSEINLAFFDEPTTNMDAERRGNLAQQIGRIKDFQQLFVISHDDTFEGFTDQVVLLGERSETQAA